MNYIKNIYFPLALFINDSLIGENLQKSCRKLSDLEGVFSDQQAYKKMSKDQVIYDVCSWIVEDNESTGALNFGITKIYSGKVGDEYYMTKGHFHQNMNSAEFYWGIKGEGILILMDQNRNTWGEKMFPGSLHYIKPGIAHRVANIGNVNLSFAACWPSDAGHNYEEILNNGFSASLQEVDGLPKFI